MASSSRSSIRRISHAGALVAGLLISSQSTSARAQPAAVVSAAPATPPPPAAIAPAPPPYGFAPRFSQVGAPAFEVPTYVYIPQDGLSGLPRMSEMPDTLKKRTWYGWQTLLVFGGSTTVGLLAGFVGGSTESSALVITGASLGGVGLVFGGPIVHWAHGNVGRGFGALGLNFGMPLVSGGLGIGVACLAGGCSGHDASISVFLGAMFGSSLGLLGAMIVDVAALSYDTKAPVASTAFRKAPTWTLLPDVRITREKSTFGFAGVF